MKFTSGAIPRCDYLPFSLELNKPREVRMVEVFTLPLFIRSNVPGKICFYSRMHRIAAVFYSNILKQTFPEIGKLYLYFQKQFPFRNIEADG